jgi:hypothetical protein
MITGQIDPRYEAFQLLSPSIDLANPVDIGRCFDIVLAVRSSNYQSLVNSITPGGE